MIIHINDKDAFENYQLCHKCGGRCCKNSPCILDKSDLDASYPKDIVDAIKGKKLTIRSLEKRDWYKELNYFDFPYLYLSSKGEYDMDVNMLTLPGKCLNLTSNGCIFSSKERPKGGRMLVPKADFHCSYESSKQIYNLISSWRCMQRELREAAEIMTGATVDELARVQYDAINGHEDRFLEDEMLHYATYHYARSYHYCMLVRQYGLALSPNAMDSLDVFARKFPEKAQSTIEELKSYDGIENCYDSVVRNIIYSKLM